MFGTALGAEWVLSEHITSLLRMQGGKQGVVAGRSGDLYQQGVEQSRAVPSCAGGRRQDLQEDGHCSTWPPRDFRGTCGCCPDKLGGLWGLSALVRLSREGPFPRCA